VETTYLIRKSFSVIKGISVPRNESSHQRKVIH